MTEPTRDELLKEIEELKRQLAASQSGSDAIAQGERPKATSERGVITETAETVQTGDNARDIDSDQYIEQASTVIFAQEGARIIVGEEEIAMNDMERDSALGRYLQYIISRNRYLQLQGIRSGGKLVHIELDRIYIRLRTSHQLSTGIGAPSDNLSADSSDNVSEQDWLCRESALAPGEAQRHTALSHHAGQQSVSVEEALAQNRRLVILGDPGSGKTTLTRYLALLYARDIAEKSQCVEEKLHLKESGCLPILFNLREIGLFLSRQPDESTDGHRLMLDFFVESLRNERIDLAIDFFDEWLNQGQAVVLLDGLDEVADPDMRRRVSALVQSFTRAYPRSRFVITSRTSAILDRPA
ncbi:NACHT domain-containing protein [Chloroflexi bacterium TSY]|nr:NACHT domain-containing protein [Chloroflexi bacterium TSY]